MSLYRVAIALLLAVVGERVSAEASNYQSFHIASETLKYATPIRFADLGFAAFDATKKYTATVCEKAVDIAELTADYAVVLLKDRAAAAGECKLTIKPEEGDAFTAGKLQFALHDHTVLPTVLEISPSFYFATTSDDTVVTIKGFTLDSAAKVALKGAAGPKCESVSASKTQVTCTLPKLTAEQAAAAPLVFYVYTAEDKQIGMFEVQSIAADAAKITAIEPLALTSGATVTVTLDKALDSRAALPWKPVLTSLKGVPQLIAAVSELVWAEEGKKLSFKLTCASCHDQYRLALGEANAIAGPVLRSAIKLDFPPAELPTCTYVGTVFPPVAALQGVVAGKTKIFVPLSGNTPISATITFEAGSMPAPAEVHETNAGSFVAEVTLDAAMEAGKVRLIVDAAGTKCAVADAFELTAAAAADAPYIATAVPNVFFFGGAAQQKVTLAGSGLAAVTSVEIVYAGGKSAKCANVKATAEAIECDFPVGADATEGMATITAVGTVRASVLAFVAADPKAAVTPATASATFKTNIDIELAAALPAFVPWVFKIVNPNGEALPDRTQWTTKTSVAFRDVRFPDPGACQVRLSEHGAARFTVGAITVENALTSVFPSQLQSNAMEHFSIFRLTMAKYDAEVSGKIASVRIGGTGETKIIQLMPVALVAFTFTAEFVGDKTDFAVEVFDKDGKSVFKLDKAIHVAAITSKLRVQSNDQSVFVTAGAKPMFKVPFVNAPSTAAIVTANVGKFSQFDLVKKGDISELKMQYDTACKDCDGEIVTVTFDFSKIEAGLPVLVLDFQLASLPELVSFTPMTFDFSVKPSACIPYTLTVGNTPHKALLTAAFPAYDGLVVSNPQADITAGTFTGCVSCQGCSDQDAVPVAFAPAFTDTYYAHSTKFKVRVAVTPEPKPHKDDGLSPVAVAFIVILVLAVVGAGGFFGYRYWRKRQATLVVEEDSYYNQL